MKTKERIRIRMDREDKRKEGKEGEIEMKVVREGSRND